MKNKVTKIKINSDNESVSVQPHTYTHVSLLSSRLFLSSFVFYLVACVALVISSRFNPHTPAEPLFFSSQAIRTKMFACCFVWSKCSHQMDLWIISLHHRQIKWMRTQIHLYWWWWKGKGGAVGAGRRIRNRENRMEAPTIQLNNNNENIYRKDVYTIKISLHITHSDTDSENDGERHTPKSLWIPNDGRTHGTKHTAKQNWKKLSVGWSEKRRR